MLPMLNNPVLLYIIEWWYIYLARQVVYFLCIFFSAAFNMYCVACNKINGNAVLLKYQITILIIAILMKQKE